MGFATRSSATPEEQHEDNNWQEAINPCNVDKGVLHATSTETTDCDLIFW